jgi:hypothetical protein
VFLVVGRLGTAEVPICWEGHDQGTFLSRGCGTEADRMIRPARYCEDSYWVNGGGGSATTSASSLGRKSRRAQGYGPL